MNRNNLGMFSRREISDILISLIVLSLVFSYPEFISNPVFLFSSLLAVGVAFLGHELSHRFTARKFGYFAEYRMWTQGIMLAILFTVFSNGNFIFAAPGAVMFSSFWVFQQPTMGEIGKIGIAGPVFNIVLMFILIGVSFFFPFGLLIFAAMINGYLAIFNLIPFGPLDGNKVLAWSKKAWALASLAAIIGLALIFLL